MSSFKALQINGYVSSVDELKVVDVSSFESIPYGYAVVQVKVASMNPVDTYIVLGGMAASAGDVPFPYTAGIDFSGVVSAIGDDVSNVSIGDEVFGMNWGQMMFHDAYLKGGAFAQYICIHASKLSKKPAALPFDTAACIGCVGTTAYEGVIDRGGCVAGSRILVLGGSSAVGAIAIQIAKFRGAHVVTTCSSRSFNYVQSFGPDKIIDYGVSKWDDDADVKNFDIVFDTVGEKDGLSRAVANNVVKSDGIFISIAEFSIGFDPNGHAPLKMGCAFGVKQNTATQSAVGDLIVSGNVRINIENRFPFTTEGVVACMKQQMSGKSLGKNVLIVDA